MTRRHRLVFGTVYGRKTGPGDDLYQEIACSSLVIHLEQVSALIS